MRIKILIVFLLFGLLSACNFPLSSQTTALPPTASNPTVSEPTLTTEPTEIPTCLQGGSQVEINNALHGSQQEAVLCPNAVFSLTGPVVFNKAGQKVYTQGQPVDETRAILRITSPDLTSAVVMRDIDHAELSYVAIDGNRIGLGAKGGDALIYAGGFSTGQVISHNVILNTRSWSSLHLIEGGADRPCANALVEENEIGPAGNSDNWADGISLACTKSTVRNNRITDATDGGIVIFGAPGSVIEGNVVRAQTRTLLGGINMVDYAPYNGNYSGTIVRNNIIDAAGAVIRIGLGMGQYVWGCFPANDTTPLFYGASVTSNTLQGDHMQYGYLINGVKNWTVSDNIDNAKHTGKPTQDCGGEIASAPSGFQYDPTRSEGTFQEEFTAAKLDLALWAIKEPLPGQ
jgi:hypothetical protein